VGQDAFKESGFQAVYQCKGKSFSSSGHKLYPYLLEGVKIERPNQVWGVDITYIRLAHGFVYLVVVMDWFSRYIFSWGFPTHLIPGSVQRP